MNRPPYIRYDSSADGYIETITGRGRRLPTDMVAAIRAGRLIDAIRAWRTFSGETLLESKLFIEAIMGKEPPKPEPKMTNSPEGGGTLPKQDLLLKMLRMTESDNDGQALVAIRKANALLTQNGWSWEKLIHAKITVVEDPFASKGGNAAHNPFANASPRPAPAPPQQPRRPQRTPPKPQPAPQAQAWQSPSQKQAAHAQAYGAGPTKAKSVFPVVDSTKSNRYPNTCYCCGTQVDANAGFIFNPSTHNTSAIDAWQVICTPCNASTSLAIPNRKAKPKASAWTNVGLNDL